MKTIATLALVGASLALTSPAQADTLNYELTGKQNASFQLYTKQWNHGSFADYFIVDFARVTTADCTSVYDRCADSWMRVFFEDAGGGFQVHQGYLPEEAPNPLTFSGPQLFSGTKGPVTMLTGTFALSDGYTLTVTEVAPISAVPEPATWAMMIVGFGAIGVAMRRSRRQRARIGYSFA